MNGNAFHKPEDDRQYVIARSTIGGPAMISQILFGYDEASKQATKLAVASGKPYFVFELVASVEVKAKWEYFGDEPQ